MSLQVYNVRTRQKEPFSPMQDGMVGVYLCGLTVYDHMHIGHGRTAVAFEIIRRWLEEHYEVRFVQNVTDVEDKIIARAAELGVSPREHSAKWDRICAEAVARLGVRPPDEAPHVTDSIEDIIAFIQPIIDNGHAYVTDQGNVYFDVPGYADFAEEAFPDCGYGSLSRRDYREMTAGTRKEVEADKRHPADFALWKAAGDEHPDANWDSPWGRGRPGWHIECSLMSTRALGYPIDIHGGGQDLIFPHHENEIAQSQAHFEAAPFVHTWVHSGFLNVEGQKMSKSLGNFIVLTELLDELQAQGVDPEALRFYYLQTHYRSKIDFSHDGLEEATTAWKRLVRTRRLLAQEADKGRSPGDADGSLAAAAAKLVADFDAAMDDDFHTPGALAALFAFQRDANKAIDSGILGAGAATHALAAMDRCGRILSLFTIETVAGDVPEALSALAAEVGAAGDDEATLMTALLQRREEARQAKDFATADQVRDGLKAAGYVIEDTPSGPRWERA